MKKEIGLLINLLLIMGIFLFCTTNCNKKSDNIAVNDTTVMDADGNVYHFDTIGTQIWMRENLKTTKFNDNSLIPMVLDGAEWNNLTMPACCWYNNDIMNEETYGTLYNWYAVNSGILCPKGWHVPSDAEWTTLINNVGNASNAGGFLKESLTTHWTVPNTGATNSVRFTALPGGSRFSNGLFYTQNNNGFWWSSTPSSTTEAWQRIMSYNSTVVVRISDIKYLGLSVRCIKNN